MACESTLSDSALLRRMIAGDEEAFTTLYRRHQGRVYRLALHMSGRSSIAEEVTQDGNIKVGIFNQPCPVSM